MAVNDKKITELLTTASFSTGDLMVVRKSDIGDDRKISYANVVKSLGNTAVQGFNAIQGTDVNKILLTPANGVELDDYYNNMTISFFAPAATTGNVEIKINNLEFATLLRFAGDQTEVLAAGEYVEAVYDAANTRFLKTNNSSQPNSSTEYSVGGTVNIIELSSMNALVKETYYDGMVVNFLTKGDSTANVTIKVDGLAALPLKNQFSQQVNNLINDQLVTASYKALPNPHFVSYIVKDSYVTNDYIVSSYVIAPSDVSTTLNLTTADGAAKTRYYNAMSLVFTSTVDTKGIIYLNIDGLGNKILKDPDELDDSLENGEAIVAIYDGTKFVKRMFTTTEQIAPPVVDPDNPPPSNLVTINVGAAREIKTITDAVQALRKSYGDDGGNRVCTILLDAGFAWNERLVVASGLDLRWITIRSTGVVPFLFGGSTAMSIANGAASPVLSLSMSNNLIGSRIITSGEQAILTIKGANFVSTAGIAGSLVFGLGTFYFHDSMLDGWGFLHEIIGRTTITNCNFINCLGQIGRFRGEIYFTNVTFSTSASQVGALSLSEINNGTMTSCTVLSTTNPAMQVTTSRVTLTNCNVKTSDATGGAYTSFIASSGADVTLSGGDYRGQNGTSINSNIIASGQGTYIRITGTVLGGRTAQSGGVIV